MRCASLRSAAVGLQFLWRETRPEGKTLSSTDTLENQSAPNPAEESHAHEGHDHAHDHDHEHAHGPIFNPECTRELVLDIPADEVAKSFKATVRTYQRYARIPGFRPGKVPESVVRRKFASEIRKEVIDALLPERFNAGVRELGIQPVGQPQVAELTIEEGQPLHVKAVFEYVPEFSIEGYKEGARQFPALVPVTPQHASVAQNLEAWKVLERFERPLITAFSDSDPITKGGEAPFQARVPGAQGQPHVTLHGGHFLQEDSPDAIVEVIAGLITRRG